MIFLFKLLLIVIGNIAEINKGQHNILGIVTSKGMFHDIYKTSLRYRISDITYGKH